MHIGQNLCSFEPAGGGNAACHVPSRNLGRWTKLILFMEQLFLVKGFLDLIIISDSSSGSYSGIESQSVLFNIVRCGV